MPSARFASWSTAGVCGDDHCHVRAAEPILLARTLRSRAAPDIVDEGVVIADLCAAIAAEVDDLQRRRLAHVARAALVRHAETRPSSPYRLPRVVERPLDLLRQKYGIAWLTLPASSMNSVDMSYSRAFHVR